MTSATFTAPQKPLLPTRTPDKVLVIGGTGHVGRVFLEQGLAMYGERVEFRVLARSPSSARDIAPSVRRVPGDIRDLESLRSACEGFGDESIIFDSSTYINLSQTDPDGAIVGTNLDGPLNVLKVARELGASLQKAHSQAGLAAPRSGPITEDTPTRADEEEDVYAKVPYLLAKKQVTQELLAAQSEGARVMVSYLVTPWGPFSREDALTLNILQTSLRLRRYVYPAGVGVAYIDARDAAKVHWLAYMNEVHDHLVLSQTLTQRDFVDLFEANLGVRLRMHALQYGPMLRMGDAMDWLSQHVLKDTTFPLSNSVVKLMFANNAYSSAKAEARVGFAARAPQATFGDHFQDLVQRSLLRPGRGRGGAGAPPRAVSIW